MNGDALDGGGALPLPPAEPDGQSVVLREEHLVPHKETEDIGQVTVRTYVEEFPGQLDVDAFREEVEVERLPVGQVVAQRQAPWEENGIMVIPVYEEHLVVSKQLVLKEQIRIRRVRTVEKHRFENTLHRERVAIEPPADPAFLHQIRNRGTNGNGHANGDGLNGDDKNVKPWKWPFHKPNGVAH